MSSEVYYQKKDKIYRVQKHVWRPKKVKIWLLIPLVAMLALGIYGIISAVGMEKIGEIEYDVKGDVDYKVYLKENNYYTEKFLGRDMQYIANLINVVNADFSYQLMTDGLWNGTYSYQIVATAKATERNDATKVLYENTEVLKESGVQLVTSDTITIRDNVDIDYPKYNEYMQNFRAEFGLAADCVLDLQLIVKTEGAIETTDALTMKIPLSNQTTDITVDTKALNRSEKVGTGRIELYVKSWPLLAVGSAIAAISLILIVIVCYYYATRYNNDLYEKALHKILKDYDTDIVDCQNSIAEYEDVAYVNGIREMLDVSYKLSSPIVFAEVESGNKAYFVVNDGVNGITYRYTVSRAYQNHLAANGEKEEF